MKINKFLLGAFALSVGFASCSNEEPIKGENGGGTTDGEKYVSVRIQSVGDNGSRAVGEGFEEGIGNESSITPDKIRFYFFTKDGRPFVMSKTGVNGEVSNTNMVAPTEITTNNTTDGQPASMNGVLVLGTAAEGYKGNAPVYVICVANPTSSIPFEKFANQNMESLLSIEANAPTNLQANSSFVMTSSTYFDGNNLIYYTDLTGKIFDTADKAKETPADIYIERLASKVRATGLKESTVQEYNDAKELTAAKYTIHTLNAANEVEITADKNLSVELTGWRLRNTATNNYAIKNLLNSWLTAAPFDAWNISELHRSYWTNPSSSSDTDIAHVDFDIYNEAEFSNKNFIAETPTANIVYCYENTIQPASLSDRDNKSTAIVVRGIVKMDNQPVNLCKWGGDYYTEDALKQVIINTYNMNVNEGDRLTAKAVGFKAYTKTENNDAKSNTWYAYVQTQTGEVHNGYRFSNISRWVDGQTSYVVNVKHMGDKFGVVRNHIYDYEFTDVVGLGVPGNNPKNPDPETETYLAARVHVLNWHVVSNKVILE